MKLLYVMLKINNIKKNVQQGYDSDMLFKLIFLEIKNHILHKWKWEP
jgi:hypothetical protein